MNIINIHLIIHNSQAATMREFGVFHKYTSMCDKEGKPVKCMIMFCVRLGFKIWAVFLFSNVNLRHLPRPNKI